jgi:hypothetical protein
LASRIIGAFSVFAGSKPNKDIGKRRPEDPNATELASVVHRLLRYFSNPPHDTTFVHCVCPLPTDLMV